jgi:ligand-binding sensor domain-containing protein/signal transduction histidine kinase
MFPRSSFKPPYTVTIFLLLTLAFVFAPAVQAERLPIKTYTVADGLLRDSITRVRQDSRGFLWFCTHDGISRFDGYGFTNFRSEDGLPDRHANDFLETRAGIYLIATDNGIARLNPRGIRGSAENPLFTVYAPEDPKAKAIEMLYEDSAGTVWAGTKDGLYRFNENFELEKIPLPVPSSEAAGVGSLLEDKTGSLWIGSWNSLFRRLPSGEIELYTAANGLPNGGVSALYEDAEGRIWAGMRPGTIGGVIRLVSNPTPGRTLVERHYTMADGLPSSWIVGFYQSSDGRFWLSTSTGLCLWHGDGGGSVCQNYIPDKELSGFGVTNLLEDRDGNLWFGTTSGVKKLIKYGFTTYTIDDGFKIPVVNSVFENSTGDLFVSLNPGVRYISRFDGNKFIHQQRNLTEKGKYSGWGWMRTIWQDHTGTWWIPSGDGLYRSPPNTDFEKLSTATLSKVETGAEEGEVFRIFEDSRGDIWIATLGKANELLRWERANGTWHNYTAEAGFSSTRMGASFSEDLQGNLWIATGSDAGGDSALIRYRNGNFKVFSEAEGAPPGWTRDMHLDRWGRLWLANTVKGLLRLDDTNSDVLNFVNYTTANGLSSNGAYCVTDDEFGRIYIGSGRGLDRLDPATGQVENFTQADSLPGSQVEIAYRDKNGILWFGTNFGLARFAPEPKRQRKPPTVFLTGLRTAGVAQPVSILGETSIPDMDFGSSQSNVSIDFLGLGAAPGEKLNYEYRVKGEDWSPTNERTVNFANLSAGNYLFEVRAVSADRLYSDPAVFSFRIESPVWQRWWFVLAISILVAGIVYLIYRNRIQRLLEMERMRTRIATDLHDDIGSNLTRISILSEVARQKSGNGNGDLLSSIANIARESVASMNDIVWAVTPEHDSLLDLTRRMRRHAEEVFASRDIELQFEAPEPDTGLKLGVGIRRDILLVFKEAVNNAARHSECSKVNINMRAEQSTLMLEVIDNGRGFDESENESGQGLRSMRRRAAAMGGEFTLDSDCEHGTTVRLVLPLAKVERV